MAEERLTGPASVLVVDRQRVFADVLARFLDAEPDLQVVGVASAADEAAAMVDHRKPDLVLVGIEDGHGPAAVDPINHRGLTHEDPRLDVVRKVMSTRQPPVVVAISTAQDPALLTAAARAGVRTWIAKESSARTLVAHLRGSLNGESYYPPRLLGAVLAGLADGQKRASRAHNALDKLTERELDVVRHLVDGHCRSEIAQRMYLSPNTVRTHVQHVLAKLEVHTTIAAVAVAREAGLQPR